MVSAGITPFIWSIKRWNGFQTGFSLRLSDRKTGAKTLTDSGSRPIRPRFLEMDMILDPRAALYVLPGAGMEEDF
jgi:hypothetical protein